VAKLKQELKLLQVRLCCFLHMRTCVPYADNEDPCFLYFEWSFRVTSLCSVVRKFVKIGN
jgi:hypothetical protein